MLPRPSRRPADPLGIAADVQKRVTTGFSRWAPGILGGRTNVASPVSPTGRGLAVPTTVAPTAAGLPFMQVVLDSNAVGGGDVPTNTWTQVALDAGNSYGEGDAFEISGDGVTVLKMGWVNFTILTRLAANVTGVRGIRLLLAGAQTETDPQYIDALSSASFNQQITLASSDHVKLANVGQAYTVEVWQNSGVSLALSNGLLNLTMARTL